MMRKQKPVHCQLHTLTSSELKLYVIQFSLFITHPKNQYHWLYLL